MTETRACQYEPCSKTLPVTHRADAKFCDRYCRNADGNEKRRVAAATGKRLTPGVSGAGSRGGNLRSVQEARDAQATVKAKRDWSGAIDEQIRRTLVETSYFHADDLDPLGVPPEHCNLKGIRIASFSNRGLMEKSGAERKVSSTAGISSNENQGEGSAGSTATNVAGTLDRPGPPEGQPSSGAPTLAADPGGKDSVSVGLSKESALPTEAESAARLFGDAPPSQYDPYKDAA